MPTICPAPTTPNLLTSAAAASLELVLKEHLEALLAKFVNWLLASKGEDMARRDWMVIWIAIMHTNVSR